MTALVQPARAPAPADDAAVADRRPGRRPAGLRLALALAVVAALVQAVVLGRQLQAERNRAQDRADAVATARQVAANFSTLSYRTFDRDIARVAAETTGSFHQDFVAQAAQIKKVVVQDRSVSTGQVGPVALVSSTPTSARVLVSLDANVTNTATTTPAARHYRVQLDLAKVHGRWLASQLQFVG
jgi:Mce-associated membrane protein